MPELPEVETVRAGLAAALEGARIDAVKLHRADLRIPFPAEMPHRLAGAEILRVERRAKYLLLHLSTGAALIAHLGMTGRFSVLPAVPRRRDAHDHVTFQLQDGRAVVYNDARRFGLMTLCEAKKLDAHPLLAELGPEPMGRGFSPTYLKAQLLKRKTAVKIAIMDQSLVVGVGNIYASEALFLAGIDPRIAAFEAAPRATTLHKAIRKVLADALVSGGSSLRDFLHVSGDSGYFQHQFAVYGREGEPCPRCAREVLSLRQGGRSSFFCANCQV